MTLLKNVSPKVTNMLQLVAARILDIDRQYQIIGPVTLEFYILADQR